MAAAAAAADSSLGNSQLSLFQEKRAYVTYSSLRGEYYNTVLWHELIMIWTDLDLLGVLQKIRHNSIRGKYPREG